MSTHVLAVLRRIEADTHRLVAVDYAVDGLSPLDDFMRPLEVIGHVHPSIRRGFLATFGA